MTLEGTRTDHQDHTRIETVSFRVEDIRYACTTCETGSMDLLQLCVGTDAKVYEAPVNNCEHNSVVRTFTDAWVIALQRLDIGSIS